MDNQRKRRFANYFWCRERHAIGDELEWMRIEGLKTLNLPRPIVLITGAFDILHVGHMRLLFTARQQAGNGTVICAMNSDDSVTERKGQGRPIMSWPERAAALAYMPIDVLVEFDTEKELKKLVALVEPDLQVVGPDWMDKPTTSGLPKGGVREAGMRTSEIIKRCKKVQNVD